MRKCISTCNAYEQKMDCMYSPRFSYCSTFSCKRVTYYDPKHIAYKHIAEFVKY